MINVDIRYEALIFSPDFCELKLELKKVDKDKDKEKEKNKLIKKCWYCDRECNTFISICELCTKYRKKRKKE